MDQLIVNPQEDGHGAAADAGNGHGSADPKTLEKGDDVVIHRMSPFHSVFIAIQFMKKGKPVFVPAAARLFLNKP